MMITILIITTVMILITMIGMIKMVINDNDNNYEYANDDNGDQATTTFPIMDLRESLINEETTFLTLTHV